MLHCVGYSAWAPKLKSYFLKIILKIPSQRGICPREKYFTLLVMLVTNVTSAKGMKGTKQLIGSIILEGSVSNCASCEKKWCKFSRELSKTRILLMLLMWGETKKMRSQIKIIVLWEEDDDNDTPLCLSGPALRVSQVVEESIVGKGASI